MTPRRLLWLLRTRGPGIDTWPTTDRTAALALLRTDAAARNALADAWAADETPEPDAASQRRIARTVGRAIAPPPPLLRGLRAAAMAACVAAGLFLGLHDRAAEIDMDSVVPLALTVTTTGPATVLASIEP